MTKTLTNRRFDGFLKTPFLWNAALEGLEMFKQGDLQAKTYPEVDADSHIRLGKLIEQFVFFEFEQDHSIELLKTSLQVFEGKTTIGELDCLIKRLSKTIHLEIVYKFYLYDPCIFAELDRWIGPNRNDSLIQKLTKLKEKQLPLLYRPEAMEVLAELDLMAKNFTQKVYFKAQLFVPFNYSKSSFLLINNDCIQGVYLHPNQLAQFESYTFYIPSKLDWLVEPHEDVGWLSYSDFKTAALELLKNQRSPLCWMKSVRGKMNKMFVVWW